MLSLDSPREIQAAWPGHLFNSWPGLSSNDGRHYWYEQAQLAAQAAATPSPSPMPYILIIDQFEEIIMTHLGRWQERRSSSGNSTRPWRTIPICGWC